MVGAVYPDLPLSPFGSSRFSSRPSVPVTRGVFATLTSFACIVSYNLKHTQNGSTRPRTPHAKEGTRGEVWSGHLLTCAAPLQPAFGSGEMIYY